MLRLNKFIIIFILLLIVFFAPIIFTTKNIFGNFGDLYLHYYPLKHLISEHIIAGKIPLWNPYIYTGQPLLANPQSATFYPLSILFYILPLPVAFNYFIVIHFFLGGLFFYILLNYLNFSRSTSFFGAVTFIFSSFLIYKVPSGHPIALSGYIWIPIVLFGLEQLKKTRSLLSILFLSFVLVFQFLSGHTQPVYLSLTLVLFHFLLNKAVYWKEFLNLGLITISLSALQFVPTLQLSQIIENAIWPKLTENYSLPFKNFINFFLPNYYGNIIDGTFKFPSNPSYFFEKHSLYIGQISIFLSLLGIYISFRFRKFFYILLFILGFVISLGFYNPIYKFSYFLIPGLKYLRVPARFIFLSIFSLVLLSCIAWDYYIKKTNLKFKFLLIILIIIDLFWWGKKFIYSEDIQNYRKKSEFSKILNPIYRVITEPENISPNKSMLYHHYNINGYEAILLQSYTRYLGLQEKKVLTTTGLARPNLNSPLAEGLSIAYYITPYKIPNKKLLFSAPSGLNLYLYSNKDIIPRIFFPLSTTIITEEEGFEVIDYLKKTKYPPSKEIIVNHIPKGFTNLTESAKLISFESRSNKITSEIILKNPSTVVFSDIYAPGWKAYAYKKEYNIHRGNKSFRTLFLPSGKYIGKNKVVLYYHPISWLFGLLVSIISFFSIIAFLIIKSFTSLVFNFDNKKKY